jgi:hypothetical protein
VVDQAQDGRLKYGQKPRKSWEILDTVKGMLTWDLNPTYKYENGVFFLSIESYSKGDGNTHRILKFGLSPPLAIGFGTPVS